MLLIDGEQLDVEDEGGAAGDTWLRKLAVAHLGGDVDLPSVLLFALPEQPVAYCGYLIAIVERCHVFHALA